MGRGIRARRSVGTGLAECSVGLQARPKPLWQTVHGLDLMSNRRSPLGLGRLPGAWRREGVPYGEGSRREYRPKSCRSRMGSGVKRSAPPSLDAGAYRRRRLFCFLGYSTLLLSGMVIPPLVSGKHADIGVFQIGSGIFAVLGWCLLGEAIVVRGATESRAPGLLTVWTWIGAVTLDLDKIQEIDAWRLQSRFGPIVFFPLRARSGVRVILDSRRDRDGELVISMIRRIIEDGNVEKVSISHSALREAEIIKPPRGRYAASALLCMCAVIALFAFPILVSIWIQKW